MVKKLYTNGDIGKELFYQTTGMIKTASGSIQRISGTQAKYFANKEMGYVYPLLKTHKLNPEDIENVTLKIYRYVWYKLPVTLISHALRLC